MEDAAYVSASPSETLMASLLSLPPSSFARLAASLAADRRRLRSRLACLLLSPPHFSRALARLHSLPLPAKALLLSRLLLRSLLLLLPPLSASAAPLPSADLDAAILLLAMCDAYDPSCSSSASPSPVDWRAMLVIDMAASALSISGLGATSWASVAPYVDAAAKCRRFADVVSEGRAGKAAAECAASAAAVVALPPAVGEGAPCAICREEMEPRRAVCGLPCGHRFHWPCATRWLARHNTCPCCRAEMPAEDALAEMRRLWRAVASMARGGSHGCA